MVEVNYVRFYLLVSKLLSWAMKGLSDERIKLSVFYGLRTKGMYF